MALNAEKCIVCAFLNGGFILKRFLITVVCILLVLAATLGIVYFAFPDLYKTASYFFKYSSGQSLEQIDKTNEEIYNSFFNSLTPEEFSGLTQQELELIKSGALTEQEMFDLVMSKMDKEPEKEDKLPAPELPPDTPDGEIQPVQPQPLPPDTPDVNKEPIPAVPDTQEKEDEPLPPAPPQDIVVPDEPPKEEVLPEPPSDTEPEKKDISAQKAKLVTKLYSLKTEFTNKLDSVINSALSEYSALPEEQRTSSAKKKILKGKLSEISRLEKECDARVEEVAKELEKLLSENGESLELAESLRKAYKEEKALKRSYYINKALGN